MKSELPVALAISLFAIGIIVVFAPVEFYINDDTIIQSVLSGSVSGSPTPYAFYPNYLICVLPSLLFAVAPNIPWWFVELEAINVLSLAFFLYASFLLLPVDNLARSGRYGCRLLLSCCGVAFVLFPMVYPSFTFSSALAAAASCLLLLTFFLLSPTLCKSHKALLLAGSLFMLFVSACMRFQGAIIGLGFLLATLLASLLIRASDSNDSRFSLRNTQLFVVIMGAVLVCGSVWCIQKVAYSGEDWCQYAASQHARSAYMDYPHQSFSDNPDAYKAYGWTEDLYDLAQHWFAMDSRIDNEAYSALSGEKDYSFGLATALYGFLNSSGVFRLHLVAALLVSPLFCICSAACCCLHEEKRRYAALTAIPIFLPILGLGYLAAAGRLILRAMLCVLYPALFFSWALLLYALRDFDSSHAVPIHVPLFSASASFLVVIIVSVVPSSLESTSGLVYLLAVWPLVVAFFLHRDKRRLVSLRSKHVASDVVIHAAFLVPLCISLLVCTAIQISEESENREVRATQAVVFREYAEGHPDQVFINNTCLYSTSIYPNNPKNVICWGGWEFDAPWRAAVYQEFGYGGLPLGGVFLSGPSVYATVNDRDTEILARYLGDITDKEVKSIKLAELDGGVQIVAFRVAQ